MELRVLPDNLCICRVRDLKAVDWSGEPVFVAKTDEELSLVCPEDRMPEDCLRQSAGWRALRVQGVLDFSLTGILSRIAGVLAEAEVSIFAVSTYNTDYILVRQDRLSAAVSALEAAGYGIAE